MNRWFLAGLVGVGSFLAGTFFEAMSENSRSPADFAKIGAAAFCRVAGKAENAPVAARPDKEQQNYLQTARQLVIFKKILSGDRRFLILYSDSSHGAPIAIAREAAEKLGIELVEKLVKSIEEMAAALEQMTIDKLDGVFHVPDDWVDRHADIMFETARMRKLPTMTFSKTHVAKGALASYGTELYQCELRKSLRTDRISTVAGATDMAPKLIKRPFLEINLKTAAEIGLEIPATVLLRATKVIK